MDYNEIIAIVLKEGEIYARNLAVPLTITLITLFGVTRAIRAYEVSTLRTKHRDRFIEEVLQISHSFNEFLDMFHIRSKYNPQLIETLSEKIALQMANLNGLSAVYFAKKGSISKLGEELKQLRNLYTLLVGRKEPFQSVSPTDYMKFQQEFAEILTNLMKIIRNSKII